MVDSDILPTQMRAMLTVTDVPRRVGRTPRDVTGFIPG